MPMKTTLRSASPSSRSERPSSTWATISSGAEVALEAGDAARAEDAAHGAADLGGDALGDARRAPASRLAPSVARRRRPSSSSSSAPRRRRRARRREPRPETAGRSTVSISAPSRRRTAILRVPSAERWIALGPQQPGARPSARELGAEPRREGRHRRRRRPRRGGGSSRRPASRGRRARRARRGRRPTPRGSGRSGERRRTARRATR